MMLPYPETLRRTASIFFLVVFLFNVGGYYIVFWGMEQKAKKNLLVRLDAGEYNESEVVVLSMPIALPYPVQQRGFERVDGEFEYNGEHFKLVKQKIENDTLFIVCIRDHQTSKIARAFSDFSKVTNNLPAGSKQAMDFLSKVFKDFHSDDFQFHYQSRVLGERVFYAAYVPTVIENPSFIESPPPENRVI